MQSPYSGHTLWYSPEVSKGLIYRTHKPSSLKTTCLFRWKPTDFHWKCLLLWWLWQRSNWSGWCVLGWSSIDVPALMIKIFEIQRWQFMPTSKGPNVKTLYDPCDLENRVKIKLLTSNKRPRYLAITLVTMGKIQLWPIKSRNEDVVT